VLYLGLKVYVYMELHSILNGKQAAAGSSGADDALQAASPDGSSNSSGASASGPSGGGKETYRFDAWNADQLPLMKSPYAPEQVNKNLRVGPPVNRNGLELQQLGFRLPRRHLCAWSRDGKTLYVVEGNALLRIDASNWQVTHRLELSDPAGEAKGLALTAEGLVVALRSVRLDDREIPGRGPNGERFVLIDPRTGRTPEVRSFRVLLVVNPDTLQWSGSSSARPESWPGRRRRRSFA
jgi:hypothetical protein